MKNILLDLLEINKDKEIIKKAIEALIKIINKWKSKNGIKGKFKISGIYEFGIWVIEDVEINIVFNDHLVSKYFGSEKSICEPLISKNCKDNSLYCFLCKEQFKDFEFTFKHLQKHTNNTQKMIELNIEGIKFTIETNENLYKHETNNFIKELPDIKNNNKFTIALFILNRWAKNNFVNQERFGFLDQYSISIMLAKIKILYPNVSLVELIEHFFLTYLEWNKSIPVQIKENQKDKINENKGIFIVLSPTNPEQILAKQINKSTTKIIEKAMLDGLKEVGEISQSSEEITTSWKKFLEPKKFSEMYQHFVLISCYATNLLEKQNFCGFVEEKLPHKLIENIENKLDKINYCHLGKKIVDLCPEINEKMPFCSTWIIGIELLNNENIKNDKKDIEERFEELIEELKLDGYNKFGELKFMLLSFAEKNN
uniref:polynucleotide adenylyltransferase n=1 Tax=Meloidogyne enterolobii TaxID=390850 RepID=A0A6V7WW23_MELEN|nr:unnamed protein product [Meloidogyne enterolobii]